MFSGKSAAIMAGTSALLLSLAVSDAAAQCAANLSIPAFDRANIQPLDRRRGVDLTTNRPVLRDPRQTVNIRDRILGNLATNHHRVGFILDRQTGPQAGELRAAVSRAEDSEGRGYAVETLTMADLATASSENYEILVFWNWSGELSARRIVELDRFVQAGGRAVFLGGGNRERPPGGAAMLAAFGIAHGGAIDPADFPERLLHFYGSDEESPLTRNARLTGRREIFATGPGRDPDQGQRSGPMRPRHSFVPAREDCGYDVVGARFLIDGITQIGMTARPDEGDGALVVLSDWRFAAHRNEIVNGRSVTSDETLQSGLWAHPNCFQAVAAVTRQNGLKACDFGAAIEAEDLGIERASLLGGQLVMTGRLTVPRGLRRIELRRGTNALQGVAIFDPFENVADLARISHTLEGPFEFGSADGLDDVTGLRAIAGELSVCAVPVIGTPICSVIPGAAPDSGARINLLSNLIAPSASVDFDRMPEALEASGSVVVENRTLFNQTRHLTNVLRNTTTGECDELPLQRNSIVLPDLVHSSTAGIAHIDSLVNMPATNNALSRLGPLGSFTVHLGGYLNEQAEFPHAGNRALTGSYQSQSAADMPELGFAGLEIRGALNEVIVYGHPESIRIVYNFFDPDSCLGQWIYGTTASFNFTSGPGDTGGRVAAAMARDFGGRSLILEGVAFGSVITEPNIRLSTTATGDRRAYGQNIDGLVHGWLVIRP